MAFNAPVSNIKDILVCMLLFGLSLFVAIVTCPAGVISRVTARTYPIRALVINRKSVVTNLHATPGLGIMTVRTLPSPVVGWPGMARLAIRLTLVVKTGGFPGAAIMAS